MAMIAMGLIDWLMSINDMYMYRSNHREKRDSVCMCVCMYVCVCVRERGSKKPHHIVISFWLFAKDEKNILLLFFFACLKIIFDVEFRLFPFITNNQRAEVSNLDVMSSDVFIHSYISM